MASPVARMDHGIEEEEVKTMVSIILSSSSLAAAAAQMRAGVEKPMVLNNI